MAAPRSGSGTGLRLFNLATSLCVLTSDMTVLTVLNVIAKREQVFSGHPFWIVPGSEGFGALDLAIVIQLQ